ncbi:hypothetical protein A9179_00285 [Pseudomonas alcaligenes]|uniref:Uncharacterized protein n=1 Tax=Aquipseudomonas alcaligenes TaxID=43263 RepID=A0ABR7RWK0_AQUAC|nr:hypothetical protein [Pseudomonas alcaligenes]MBC9248701.1 hypothetical protein [Pseudomonas alcaligenes]
MLANLSPDIVERLVKLAMLAFFGSFLLVFFLGVLLIGGVMRTVEWLREVPSPYAAIDDRYFSRCLRDAEELHQAALQWVRLENSHGMAGEDAYRSWLRLARSFDKDCGPANWPGQTVPQQPADWLPHLGLQRTDWPAEVPGKPD